MGLQDMRYSSLFMLDWRQEHVKFGEFVFEMDISEFFSLNYLYVQILAIPAIPLTMSAGLLFGSFIGTIIVSISGTVR